MHLEALLPEQLLCACSAQPNYECTGTSGGKCMELQVELRHFTQQQIEI